LPWSAPAISAIFKVGETIRYPKLWPTSMVKMTVNGKPFDLVLAQFRQDPFWEECNLCWLHTIFVGLANLC
jgi:hypothetical protein